MKKIRTLITLLLLTVHLGINAQQSYEVKKEIQDDFIEYELIGLVDTDKAKMQAIYSYIDDSESGELLKLSIVQYPPAFFTSAIVNFIKKNDFGLSANPIAIESVVFYFADGKSMEEECSLTTNNSISFILLIRSTDVLEKMESVNLKGVRINGQRFDFVNFSSTKAITALRKAAGTNIPQLQIITQNDVSVYIDGKYVGSGSISPKVNYGAHSVMFIKKDFFPCYAKHKHKFSLGQQSITDYFRANALVRN